MKFPETLLKDKKRSFYIEALSNYFEVLDAINTLDEYFKRKKYRAVLKRKNLK
ncbi:MAG: hypothetical protein GF329_05010 [Candidatus Lokiarchaeota archaeon]|nr:hypothetical protein [Candidatus Lokiarchaeota archaeon]